MGSLHERVGELIDSKQYEEACKITTGLVQACLRQQSQIPFRLISRLIEQLREDRHYAKIAGLISDMIPYSDMLYLKPAGGPLFFENELLGACVQAVEENDPHANVIVRQCVLLSLWHRDHSHAKHFAKIAAPLKPINLHEGLFGSGLLTIPIQILLESLEGAPLPVADNKAEWSDEYVLYELESMFFIGNRYGRSAVSQINKSAFFPLLIHAGNHAKLWTELILLEHDDCNVREIGLRYLIHDPGHPRIQQKLEAHNISHLTEPQITSLAQIEDSRGKQNLIKERLNMYLNLIKQPHLQDLEAVYDGYQIVFESKQSKAILYTSTVDPDRALRFARDQDAQRIGIGKIQYVYGEGYSRSSARSRIEIGWMEWDDQVEKWSDILCYAKNDFYT